MDRIGNDKNRVGYYKHSVRTFKLFSNAVSWPVIFIVSLVLAFHKDVLMGLILVCVLLLIIVVAGIIMHSTAPMFKKLQKKLDKMSKVLLENITGVRVIRAFNKAESIRRRFSTSESLNGFSG